MDYFLFKFRVDFNKALFKTSLYNLFLLCYSKTGLKLGPHFSQD